MLRTKEVAERLNISERMVRKLCDEKKIGYCKIGRIILISEEDLQNYLNSIKVEKEN